MGQEQAERSAQVPPQAQDGAELRKPYCSPAIVYQLPLETRAGTPLGPESLGPEPQP